MSNNVTIKTKNYQLTSNSAQEISSILLDIGKRLTNLEQTLVDSENAEDDTKIKIDVAGVVAG